MQKSQGYTLTSCRIPFLGSLIIVIMFCTIPLFSQQNDSWQVNARDRSLDLGWKFKLGDYYYGAEYTRYDDSDWRVLDLPHDWSIEDLTDQHPDSAIGPFSRQSPGGMSTGHVVGGTAWYRKAFVLDEQDSGQSVYLRFDGVYMESEVWINGHWCGYHPNGYMPYYYNITPHLNAAGDMLNGRKNNTSADTLMCKTTQTLTPYSQMSMRIYT